MLRNCNSKNEREMEFFQQDSDNASFMPQVKARNPVLKRSLFKSWLDEKSDDEEEEEVQEEDYQFHKISVVDQRRKLEEKIKKTRLELEELDKELEALKEREEYSRKKRKTNALWESFYKSPEEVMTKLDFTSTKSFITTLANLNSELKSTNFNEKEKLKTLYKASANTMYAMTINKAIAEHGYDYEAVVSVLASKVTNGTKWDALETLTHGSSNIEEHNTQFTEFMCALKLDQPGNESDLIKVYKRSLNEEYAEILRSKETKGAELMEIMGMLERNEKPKSKKAQSSSEESRSFARGAFYPYSSARGNARGRGGFQSNASVRGNIRGRGKSFRGSENFGKFTNHRNEDRNKSWNRYSRQEDEKNDRGRKRDEAKSKGKRLHLQAYPILRRKTTEFPTIIAHDNGAEFVNKVLDELKKQFGIATKLSMPYHPEANGAAESAVKIINQKILQTLDGNLENWSLALPCITYVINSTPHSRTGLLPFIPIFW